MYRTVSQTTFAIGIGLYLAVAGVAQEHPAVERGFAADKVFHFANSEVDVVDTFSGKLSLSIPLQTYNIGGGLSYSLVLSYSSSVYDFDEINIGGGSSADVRSRPARHFNAGVGWVLSLGKLVNPGDPGNETGRIQYRDGSGGLHGTYPTLHTVDDSEPGFSYTRDSSYLRLRELASGKRQLEFPNGEIHTFLADGRIESIEDRYSNELTITYPNALTWRLEDDHGRVHFVRFGTMSSDGASVKVVDKIELDAFGGATATYDFTYQAGSMHRACSDTFFEPGSSLGVPQLTQLTLPDPDSTSYSMTYNSAECDDGMLASITLPTTGRIEYTYVPWELPTSGCNQTNRWAKTTPGMFRRALFVGNTEIGAWTYNQQLQGPPSEPSGLCDEPNQEDPSELSVTTIRSPSGHESVSYFSVWPELGPSGTSPNGFRRAEYALPFNRLESDATGSRFLSREIFECSGPGPSNCTKRRSIYVSYEYEGSCLASNDAQCRDSNRRLASRRTIFHDDGNPRFADVTYSDFDGLSNYRRVTTGGNYPSGNVRTTFTNYNPGHDLELNGSTVNPSYEMWPTSEPWILKTYTESSKTESGSTSKVQTCFDSDTGFLLRRRKMLASSQDRDDVIEVFSPDVDGNVRFQEFFGGDTQAVTLQTNLCGMALPTSQYKLSHHYSAGSLLNSRYLNADGETSVGFLLTDNTIDSSTGLVASSRDSAGIEAEFEYDTLGRLIWAKPEAGHGAWVEYEYNTATATSPAKVKIRHRENGSKTGTILSEEEVHYDAFGRVTRERRRMPGSLNWVVRDTIYDAEGRLTQESTWAKEGDAQHWTRYLDRDAFGRLLTLRPPDGAAHDVTFSYTGDRVVRRTVQVATSLAGETASTTIERYDRQGRLYQVVEPSGTGGANVTTTYGYDEANRLVRVSTTADGTTQVRTFNYDNLGNLRSETHPEKDSPVTYSMYDSRGHAGRKVDGASVLDFTYDRAERVTGISEGSGLERPLKSFEYSTTVFAGDWAKGKLKVATRYNHYEVGPVEVPDQIFAGGFECGDLSGWDDAVGTSLPVGGPVCDLTTSYEVAVEETYSYGGIGGQVSGRDTAITLNGNTGETFTQGWIYTELGDVASVDYPRCDFSRCTLDNGAGSLRTVSTTYTRGYPTGVTGYATIAYQPNGLYDTITHSNGVVVTQAADPNGMARPASITATISGATHWTTGTYAWDGAGNIKSIGASGFVYDQVNRLTLGRVSANAMGIGSIEQQGYTYDAFGNIQSITGSPGRATPTSSATNRLEGSSEYSTAGNLTSWNGNAYEYDAFHMMTRMVAGAEDYLYVYTADDERIWQFRMGGSSPGHTYTLRDLGGQVLREYSRSGIDFWAIERDYVYRDGQLLAAETPEGRRHFHLDHLGTPRLITGPIGGRVAYHAYFPFGEEATDPLQDEERMKFTGHERDLANPDGTGDDLDYMHARFCSPLTGRFTSTDPAGGDPISPQSWNRYSYVRGNPIRYVDPTGELTASDIADKVQAALAEAKAAATAAVSDGSIAGVLVATAVGTALDAASLAVDPLRAGSATGEAIGDGTGVVDIALAIGTDAFRATSIVLPAARAGRVTVSVAKAPKTIPKIGSAEPASAGRRFSKKVKAQAREESGNTCVFCGARTTQRPGPARAEADHSIPRSRGGDNTIDNAQNTCRTCNRRKGARTTQEFLEDGT